MGHTRTHSGEPNFTSGGSVDAFESSFEESLFAFLTAEAEFDSDGNTAESE